VTYWPSCPDWGTYKKGSSADPGSPTSRTREGRGGRAGVLQSGWEDTHASSNPRACSMSSQQGQPCFGNVCSAERLRQDEQMSDMIDAALGIGNSLMEEPMSSKL
jgi:hypothetical protein